MNYTLLCDFYELTMANGYFQTGMSEQICYFDVFFRNVPDGGGFAIAAGLEQVIDYIQNLRFDDEDIDFLCGARGSSARNFSQYLSTFRFTGDIWAVPEGTPIFPGEPILTVRAPAIEAQFIETYVLLSLNHQSLIATKSNRIVRAAQGRPVSEFGSRRAQGATAPCSAPGPPTSPAAPAPPAPWPTSVRLPRRRHHGPLLGSDVPRRVYRLQDLLPALSPLGHPAGGHLQRAQVGRPQRHPGL